MVQQLQEYEIEVFSTNVGTIPILVALGLPIIRFGYPNPPLQAKLPTFTFKVVSTSLTLLGRMQGCCQMLSPIVIRCDELENCGRWLLGNTL